MAAESISIVTTFDENTITQRVAFDPLEVGHEPKAIMQKVVMLQEDAVKEALISLGWTPPHESRIVLLN